MIDLRNRFVSATAAILATIVTVGAATPGHAQSLTTVVTYQDLDLATPAGAATLNRRIRHAADRVCGPVDANNRLAVNGCRRVAMTQAKADMQLALARTANQRIALR